MLDQQTGGDGARTRTRARKLAIATYLLGVRLLLGAALHGLEPALARHQPSKNG
jgi:hypothetical protein|eukprot:COSAG01_NODE_7231_length_3293_cov_38.432783_5_plen_54_part_00